MAITGVKISTFANSRIDLLSKETGVSKLEIVSRTMEWFTNQPKALRAIVLGQIDEECVLDLLISLHKNEKDWKKRIKNLEADRREFDKQSQAAKK
jgi:hypothetical protein